MTAIGFLSHNDHFVLDGKEYKVGHIIDGTNGYVACVEIDTRQVKRFYIDTEIEEVR